LRLRKAHALITGIAERRAWPSRHFSAKGVLDVDAIAFKYGTRRTVHFHESSGVSRHCPDIRLPGYDGVALPKHYRVGRRDSDQQFLPLRVRGLIGQCHRLVSGLHLRLTLDQTDHRLANFQTDLLAQLL
jgi:hypothetical protein